MWWLWKYTIDEKYQKLTITRTCSDQKKEQRFVYYYSNEIRTSWSQLMPSSGVRQKETNREKIKTLNKQLSLHRLLKASKIR